MLAVMVEGFQHVGFCVAVEQPRPLADHFVDYDPIEKPARGEVIRFDGCFEVFLTEGTSLNVKMYGRAWGARLIS